MLRLSNAFGFRGPSANQCHLGKLRHMASSPQQQFSRLGHSKAFGWKWSIIANRLSHGFPMAVVIGTQKRTRWICNGLWTLVVARMGLVRVITNNKGWPTLLFPSPLSTRQLSHFPTNWITSVLPIPSASSNGPRHLRLKFNSSAKHGDLRPNMNFFDHVWKGGRYPMMGLRRWEAEVPTLSKAQFTKFNEV